MKIIKTIFMQHSETDLYFEIFISYNLTESSSHGELLKSRERKSLILHSIEQKTYGRLGCAASHISTSNSHMVM